MYLCAVCGSIVIFAFIGWLFVHKRQKPSIDKNPPCTDGDTALPRKVRPHLSHEESMVIESKMNEEDGRFIGSKTWD